MHTLHMYQVKPSDKRLTVAPAAAAKSSAASNGANNTNNKLIVRNVAFQATKSEIRDLFASYGECFNVIFDAVHVVAMFSASKR